MIATVAVFTTSITLHNYSFVLGVGIIKLYSLSKFHDSRTIRCLYSLYCALDLYGLFTNHCIDESSLNLPFPYARMLSY